MKTITVLLLSMVIISCTHESELKYEKGVVIEKQYSPDTRQTVTGVGSSSNGGLVFTSHQVGQEEMFLVIFKCEHNVVFAINRNDLYGNLQRGDSVIIEYIEILSDKNNEVVDLDFINATPINNQNL